MDRQEEAVSFKKMKKGNEKAFEALFSVHYSHLCLFAEHYVQNPAEAEEIVQDMFVHLWEKREQISVQTSVRNYLFRAVKNRCLNYLRHNQVKNQYADEMIAEAQKTDAGETGFIESGLLSRIEECINSLPEKRREVFRLSREEGLKYREIAEKLDISVKTVETHMGLAIKSLREKLKHFSSFILFIF